MAKLYEQENRITVVVKKEDSGATQQGNKTESAEETSTGGASGGDGGSVEKTWRTAVFGTESKERIKRIAKTNLTHALAVSKQITDLGIEYWVGGIGYNTGDQAYQQSVERTMEMVSDVTSVASSVGMGALYGAWGGPIGAVLGATMNGASTLVSLISKYGNAYREFNYKVFKEENGIEYKRARASINLTTGRLR